MMNAAETKDNNGHANGHRIEFGLKEWAIAIIALLLPGGWLWSMSNRVAVIETRQQFILDGIVEDKDRYIEIQNRLKGMEDRIIDIQRRAGR